ncbi:hypothetical protein NHH03_20090 [Stieleria sp. TO1_6]|uniref:hypothetical protein n=1 Tax=Stieleria tagensis TaxID=2956795 RepID=UPI00209AA792|nr:hypothetical protein [Stieleria tagensis]MCO8124056.1 hypothetical protein [Stieleria tagensis]
MRKKITNGLACLVATALISLPVLAADEDGDKEKLATKQIMKDAFKGPLLKKVAAGEASEEETKKLNEMLVALSKNEPKKGDAESWKKFTAPLVAAGKAAVEGKPDAGAMLKKGANCKDCHKSHK